MMYQQSEHLPKRQPVPQDIQAQERAIFEKLSEQSRQQSKYFQSKAENLGKIVNELKLNLKYLVFDLEASRRENKELKERYHDDQNESF